MAYVSVIGPCFVCKQVFSFHPNKVPSVRVNGRREPVCRACVEAANPKRAANGLEPIEVLEGAYGSAPEEEINWNDHDQGGN